MQALIIKNGVVDNVVVFDEIPEGLQIAPEGVGIGWADNGDGTFSPPTPPQKTQDELDSIKSAKERAWRDRELDAADKLMFRIQDGHFTSPVGLWRAYRNSLRDYPASADFPNGSRPSRPS